MLLRLGYLSVVRLSRLISQKLEPKVWLKVIFFGRLKYYSHQIIVNVIPKKKRRPITFLFYQ